MTRRHRFALFASLTALLVLPAAARAGFGFVPGSLSATALKSNGTVAQQAGSHPFSYTVGFQFNTDSGGELEGGAARDIIVDLPPGLVGNPLAVPRCSRQDFAGTLPRCPLDTQVGVVRAIDLGLGEVRLPVFNLAPPPGSAAQLGASAVQFNALQNASVRSEEGYGVRVGAFNLPVDLISATEVIWGEPADSAHDDERGSAALDLGIPGKSTAPKLPFLTLPTSCEAPPEITISADSKLNPGAFVEQSAVALDDGGNPAALTGCESVPFAPGISAAPTSRLAQNPSGLDFELKLPNAGLLAPGTTAETQPETTEVTLPEGVTVNPSLAEGVSVCTEAQYKSEKIDSPAGAGCPDASKLGSVIAKSPLLDEAIEGSVFLAAPYDNPFGTLTALYLVARASERGVLVKQAGKVELDPRTGQVKSTFSDLPPVPYSSFKLRFREGARAPLVTPPACGIFETVSRLTPFSAPDLPRTVNSAMTIERGTDGGACPSGGTPPLKPGLTAGTINNAAGRYSPFSLRLTRKDGEQEFTRFSIKLPPGLSGKLAGIPFCPDAAIAAAKARTGPHGGAEELASPSCPAASEVGRTLVGAGVGTSLTYVPGKAYLAGPYNGSALSVVAITAAKAGPFDLGVVAIRQALEVDSETAEVFIDSTGSDPIPHIIKGVPVHARDIRVYVDRPDFILNPTSCARKSTASTVLGSGTDFGSAADDNPFTVTSPFQAADCASLGFKPKLALSLKGGTKRGQNPAFKAVLTARPGDANIGKARITLPHSEFLDQGHIRTICTRVQFKAGAGNGTACPAGSVYGYAKAITPLLDEAVQGPVILRASSNPLPDLVAALKNGQIEFNLVGRIDSLNGQIRNTFDSPPDVPVKTFTLTMQGGKKGLLENSANLCRGKHPATAEFTGHNGKRHAFKPLLKAQCPKGKAKAKRQGRR
jgi:hypothetical protein